MLKRSAIAVATSVAALVLLYGCGKPPTLLTVVANSQTRSAPDLAIVTLGVVARGPTAQVAQQEQTTRMRAVLDAAHAAGAQDSDVQTIGYSLDPQYAQARGQAQRIVGYASRNTVSIRIKVLSNVSGLIDATVARGANELQGVQFAFQNGEASRDAARAEALATAKRRADIYARAAHLRVANIVSITEPGAAVPLPQNHFFQNPMAVAAEQSAGNVIRPGELEAGSGVTVVFALR